MSYDTKCDELARHFMPSQASEPLIAQLAQAIQNSIEDWLEDHAHQAALAASEKPPL